MNICYSYINCSFFDYLFIEGVVIVCWCFGVYCIFEVIFIKKVSCGSIGYGVVIVGGCYFIFRCDWNGDRIYIKCIFINGDGCKGFIIIW